MHSTLARSTLLLALLAGAGGVGAEVVLKTPPAAPPPAAAAPAVIPAKAGKRELRERNELARRADAGDVPSMLRLGLVYYGGDKGGASYNEAYARFHQAADGGDVRAMLAAGYLLAKGYGVARDPAQARKWFGIGEQVGYARALYLQSLLEDDLGGARGKQVARDLLERAAAAGDSAATNALGVSYESAGQRATARLWYQQSAARGGKAAARNLARIDASVPEATAERSIERLREDSANGDAEASYELAGRHHRGTGVAVDYGEAVRLYRLAAQQGSLPAQNMLSLILSRSTPAEPVNSAWMLELSHMNLPQGASLVPGATYDDPLDGLVELKPQSLPPSQAAPVIGQRAYLGAPALIGTSVTTPAPAASAPPANNDDPLSHAREMRARSSDGHR